MVLTPEESNLDVPQDFTDHFIDKIFGQEIIIQNQYYPN